MTTASPAPIMPPRWLAAVCFICALGAAFWRAPSPDEPLFNPPPPPQLAAQPARFSTALLPQVGETAYAASLTQLPDGRIALAWLAGTHEAPADHAIWFSVLSKDVWRQPQLIGNRESTAGGTFAHVRKLGNPVLYAEGSWLHLWYTSASVASWAGSSLNHSVSTDGGKTWEKPTRLQTSPFANLSTLLEAPPLPLADGGLGLAVSHDFFARHGAWLRLSPSGKILEKARLTHRGDSQQPATVVLDAQRAIAFLRSAGGVQLASTLNAGRSWQVGAVLAPSNPNTALAALRLPSGRLLLAGNPQNSRDALLLWISADEGKTWQASRTVEAAADGGAEFTHPTLLPGRDGRVHLAYTWRRQGIKHASFNEAWLDGAHP